MNKRSLVDAVAESSGLEPAQAGAALDVLIAGISTVLTAGERVTVPGLGTFEVRQRSARTGRSPQAGDAIAIAATTSPAFKAAAALKQAVR